MEYSVAYEALSFGKQWICSQEFEEWTEEEKILT